MSETTQKRLVVTFNDGLPLGVHGSFSHGGERWIAVPLPKYKTMLAAADRLISVLFRVRALLTRRVSAHPEDAAFIVGVLAEIDLDALVAEKIRAQTS